MAEGSAGSRPELAAYRHGFLFQSVGVGEIAALAQHRDSLEAVDPAREKAAPTHQGFQRRGVGRLGRDLLGAPQGIGSLGHAIVLDLGIQLELVHGVAWLSHHGQGFGQGRAQQPP